MYLSKRCPQKVLRLVLKKTQNHLFCVGIVLFLFAKAAQADPLRGKEIYERTCMACHSVNVHRVGPLHRGVFGRKAGIVEGYDFSPALKKSKIIWKEKELKAWLRGPTKYIPGSKMGFSLTSDEEIIHIIDYLKTL